MQEPHNIFGRRNWNDVRKVIFRRIWNKFPRARADDVDDAVALAMVDLVDYWMTLESSVVAGDPNQTFWRACLRGTWMATTFLTQEWDTKDVPVDDTAEVFNHGTPTAPVEDEVLDALEREQFNQLVNDRLSDLGDWLRPYLAGVTTREQAAREGVAQSSLTERWGRRQSVFVSAAHSVGLGALA